MWEDNIPVDTKEFMVTPIIYLIRGITNDAFDAFVEENRTLKVSLENLYVSEGQVLTLEIVNGHLRIRVFLKTEP